jgi:hypothetical protein
MSRTIKRDEIVAATVCFEIEHGLPPRIGKLKVSTVFWNLMMPSERYTLTTRLSVELDVFIDITDMLRQDEGDDSQELDG